MKLTHIIDPTRIPSDANRSKIHYLALDGQELLCGLGHVYKEIDGERYQIWYPTKRAVTCVSCTRSLEAIVRFQLNGLSSEQLEMLLTHIESFHAPEGGDTKERGDLMLTPRWAKSSYSNPSGSCVEARLPDGSVQVRDTKDPDSPVLKFSPGAWMEFIQNLKHQG